MLFFRPLAKRQIMTNGVYAKNIYAQAWVLRRQAKFMILAKYVTMRERKNSCRAYKSLSFITSGESTRRHV